MGLVIILNKNNFNSSAPGGFNIGCQRNQDEELK